MSRSAPETAPEDFYPKDVNWCYSMTAQRKIMQPFKIQWDRDSLQTYKNMCHETNLSPQAAEAIFGEKLMCACINLPDINIYHSIFSCGECIYTWLEKTPCRCILNLTSVGKEERRLGLSLVSVMCLFFFFCKGTNNFLTKQKTKWWALKNCNNSSCLPFQLNSPSTLVFTPLSKRTPQSLEA